MCRRLPCWLAAGLGFESARRHTVQVLQVGLLLEVCVAVPGGGRGAVLDHGGGAEEREDGEVAFVRSMLIFEAPQTRQRFAT